MERTGIVTLALIIINFLVSYKGLKDYSYLQRYSLNVPHLLISRDYKRLITASFIHSSWMHFLFNMIALYSFGSIVEDEVGTGIFLAIYFVSLLCGNAFSVFIHRNKSSYNAVGASGAICGVVFACIAMYPQMKMGFMFIPGLRLTAWIFGLLYALYCMFGIRSQRDNIGHDAHLSGGIAGVLTIALFYPELLKDNYLPILSIVLPSLVFLYLVITRPAFLLVERPLGKPEGVLTIEDRYNSSKRTKERELDALLDKINKEGIHSLTKKEKERLEQLSKVK